jgi:glycosyltransferase involved in cell wall biosynthesis
MRNLGRGKGDPMLLGVLLGRRHQDSALWKAMDSYGCRTVVHHSRPGWELEIYRVRPDVLVVYGLPLSSEFEITALSKSLRIPLILASAQTLNEPFPSGLSAVTRTALELTRVRRYSGFVADGILGVQYLLSFGCPHQRIATSLHPVDVSMWQKRKMHLVDRRSEPRAAAASRRFVALTVSASGEEANILAVLQAFAEFRRSQPGALLSYVADGPVSRDVRWQARALGIEDAVHVSPNVCRDDLAAHYAAADAYVCVPLKHCWGRSVLEAMAFGLPVIASTTVSSAADLVIHGRNGALCQPGDSRSLVAALGRVAHQCGDGRMGERAFEAVQRFDVQRATDDLTRLVRVVVERGASQGRIGPAIRSNAINEFGRWSP